MPDLNDIFADEKGKLSDEDLLKYLDGKTSEAERHAIEKKMLSSSFEEEAMEGLQQYTDRSKLENHLRQSNANLQRQLHKKSRKQSFSFKDLPMTIATVLLILSICVLAYLVIHLLTKG